MLGLRASPVAQGKWYMLRNLQFKAKNKPTSSHVYVFYPKKKEELYYSTITN